MLEEEDNEEVAAITELEEGARLKLEKSKVLLQKTYNMLILDSKVLINNGRDIYDVTLDTPLTRSLGATHNLSLLHPYIVQRHYSTCKVLSVGNMNQLYTLDMSEEETRTVTITGCQLYKGYLVAIAEQCLMVWSLAKGEELLYDPSIKGKGLYVSDYGLLVWKDAQLQFCRLGLNR